ncbi:MAG: hypothetical protein OK438_02675 [Thaumarchaeota archaeon]|nr:hypothetical protein [Nitrososphaerota archaeon]
MKVKILMDGGRPKVDPGELKRVIKDAGLEMTTGRADLGVVVGGDGVFGEYGRTETVPLLFVGVRSNKVTGSKAFLAAAYYDELPEVLERVKTGSFKVSEQKRLEVFKNQKSLGEVFTDVYVQRGAESNCLRYKVRTKGEGASTEEAVIGDGVVVTTAAGSTGYYSYPERISGGGFRASAFSKFRIDQLGICHINPTYIERSGSMEPPFRYTVPWGSQVEISLFRDADARVYGVQSGRDGVRVSKNDRVTVVPGEHSTRVISFD